MEWRLAGLDSVSELVSAFDVEIANSSIREDHDGFLVLFQHFDNLVASDFGTAV